MTVILRLLSERDKKFALEEEIAEYRQGLLGKRSYVIDPEVFSIVEGSPFAYWISTAVKLAYLNFSKMLSSTRAAKSGLSTADDFRFLRLNWENAPNLTYWKNFAKGGTFSPYYFDLHLTVNWKKNGYEVSEFDGSTIRNPNFYFRPGLTWPSRTKSELSVRALNSDCVFGHKGPSIFIENDDAISALALLGICNSVAYYETVKVQLAAAADAQRGGVAHSFEVGVIQKTPVPDLKSEQRDVLAYLARRAWSLKRNLDTVYETSHAFVLPEALQVRENNFDAVAIEMELKNVQAKMDTIGFDIYGFSVADRSGVQAVRAHSLGEAFEDVEALDDDAEDDDTATPIDHATGLLSWALGVGFGRFDWRLATGERAAPPEPDPFDPLPGKSPGMLPEGADPFHPHAGILVDDPGHKHDLAELIEEVLTHVDAPVPPDVRRWLQREFFPFHLQRYSKSRRKAPMYWPLATASGGYTLWLYYPDLNSQTLYTAVNEFIEPKLEQLGKELTALRNKDNVRSRDDDKVLEALQTLEKELMELRDTLLQIAPNYRPNHDDGVQITAAPLWPLIRYKPWQKLLKETWAKLEKGDYDWAHLAMLYWPDRVREKCKTRKSIAIGHDLEHLYVEPPANGRGRKKGVEA